MLDKIESLIAQAWPILANILGIALGAYLAFRYGIRLQRREWTRQHCEEERRKREAAKSLLVRLMIEACGNLQRLLTLKKSEHFLEHGVGSKGQRPKDTGAGDIITGCVPRLETYDATFAAIASEALVGDFTFAFILYYSHKLQLLSIPYRRILQETERELFSVKRDLDDIRRMLPDAIHATRNVIGRIRLDCPQLSGDRSQEAKRLQDIVGSFGLLSQEELQRCIREAERAAAQTSKEPTTAEKG